MEMGFLKLNAPLLLHAIYANRLPSICKCHGKSLKYLQYVDGSASLKKKPLHIMHKFSAKWLLQTETTVTFFIYTSYSTFCERISFNSEYWSDVVSNLDYFFKKYMASCLLFDADQLDVLR